MQDFLSVADLDHGSMAEALALAASLKQDRDAALRDGRSVLRDDLAGRTVALIFEKPSLRTRASFEVGVHELGGHALPMWDFEVGLGRRETIADTGAVLAGYCQAIVLRTFGQERLVTLAEAADVPVVNALSDHEHPCQAIADLQTLAEVKGSLDGRTLTYVGDGNNVAHSLLLAGALAGVGIRVIHPEGYAPDATVVAQASALARGSEILATTDTEAVHGSDAVYTDVWASMGQEEEAVERAAIFDPYRVTSDMMAIAGPDAILLHCLPAHRGEEVAADVIDGPNSHVFTQAENRLHAQKALLLMLMSRS